MAADELTKLPEKIAKEETIVAIVKDLLELEKLMTVPRDKPVSAAAVGKILEVSTRITASF